MGDHREYEKQLDELKKHTYPKTSLIHQLVTHCSLVVNISFKLSISTECKLSAFHHLVEVFVCSCAQILSENYI